MNKLASDLKITQSSIAVINKQITSLRRGNSNAPVEHKVKNLASPRGSSDMDDAMLREFSALKYELSTNERASPNS